MDRIKLTLGTVFLSALSGCTYFETNLKSSKISGIKNTPAGLTYRLPAKKFTVVTNLEITGCRTSGDDALVEATVSATLSESLVGGDAYTIDYHKLNAWTKITNTEIQISESGLLTGVNVSITDQSGTVLANTGATITSIARAAALPPIALAATPSFLSATQELKKIKVLPGQPIQITDTTNIKSQLPNILGELKPYTLKKVSADQEQSLKQLINTTICSNPEKLITLRKSSEQALTQEKNKEKSRESARKKIEQADLQITSLKNLVEFYEKLGNTEEKAELLKRVQISEKNKIEATSELQTLGISKVDELTQAAAKAKENVTISSSREFIPISSSYPCTDSDNKPATSCTISIASSSLEKIFDATYKKDNIRLPAISFSINQSGTIPSGEDKNPKDSELGIAYRIPVPATVQVKYSNPPRDNPSYLLIEQATQVPQFGPIGSINLNNGAFDDNLVEVSFNPATGSPNKFSFRAKSKAEAASASVRDAASTYLQLQKDKQSDRIAANKSNLELATSQLNLEKLQSDVALSNSDLQKSLASAQLQLLRDQQRLDAVRTGTATAAEVELEALNTQEQLLAQRLKIIKLEQEIAAQKGKSSTE